MYIKSLSYEDQSTHWRLEKINFKPLTLLVGASGVGKTRILKSLLNVKAITRGKSSNGAKWELDFKTSSGRDCLWSGAFESKGFVPRFAPDFLLERFNEFDVKYMPNVNYETLRVNGETIVDRNSDGIVFEGKKTVKLSQQQSVISLLKEEEKVKDIYEDFNRIIFDDNTNRSDFGFDAETESKLKQYKTLKAIRNSNENIQTKLFLLYKNHKASFKEITSAFIDIFPYVEDVKIEIISGDEQRVKIFFPKIPLIQIKEKNIPHWIEQHRISSGMFRTLMHIAELHLCADNTVILIDEFENSLGVNCIEQISSSIVDSERNLQFIITSHHPYIINNLGLPHWKIVTRNANVVRADDAEKFNLGKSKHEAFTQLISLDDYREGIAR